MYNEQSNSCVICIYDNGWKPYHDIIGNIIPEQAKQFYIRSGDYAKLTGFLYYHLKKQEYILKLVTSGEKGTRDLGFWCKDKKEATRGAYLGNILKVLNLESFYDPEKYKNVDTCIVIEILLRIYQYKNVLEDSLEKQWFLDPITVYLQSKVTN